MRIVLFDKLGKIGIVTGFKPYVGGDTLQFEADRDGELIIGERTYTVSGGTAHVPIINITMGEARGYTVLLLANAHNLLHIYFSTESERLLNELVSKLISAYLTKSRIIFYFGRKGHLTAKAAFFKNF